MYLKRSYSTDASYLKKGYETDKKESVSSINSMREKSGLAAIVPVVRTCLRCDRKFRSPQPNIRLCGCKVKMYE